MTFEFLELISGHFIGWDGPTNGLLRLKAKSWMDPMDHQDISAHLVTTAMVNGEHITIERAPINPVVYLEPPTVWLSGPLGFDGYL